MLGPITTEAVLAAAIVTLIMYKLYWKGQQDGIRKGIEITAEYLERVGLLSSDSDQD